MVRFLRMEFFIQMTCHHPRNLGFKFQSNGSKHLDARNDYVYCHCRYHCNYSYFHSYLPNGTLFSCLQFVVNMPILHFVLLLKLILLWPRVEDNKRWQQSQKSNAVSQTSYTWSQWYSCPFVVVRQYRGRGKMDPERGGGTN